MLAHHYDIDDIQADPLFRDQVQDLLWQGDSLDEIHQFATGLTRIMDQFGGIEAEDRYMDNLIVLHLEEQLKKSTILVAEVGQYQFVDKELSCSQGPWLFPLHDGSPRLAKVAPSEA